MTYENWPVTNGIWFGDGQHFIGHERFSFVIIVGLLTPPDGSTHNQFPFKERKEKRCGSCEDSRGSRQCWCLQSDVQITVRLPRIQSPLQLKQPRLNLPSNAVSIL